MSLSNIRLVVSDMDGTLLNSKSEISPRFFEAQKALEALGVEFVAASGRQYNSIYDKLQHVQDRVTIVAENGGYVKRGEKELDAEFISRAVVLKTLPLLRSIDGAHIVVCAKDNAYIESKSSKFEGVLSEYYSSYQVVEDLDDLKHNQVFKIAIYHFGNAEKDLYPNLSSLEKELQVKVSGSNWVDISGLLVNKGRAIRMLQAMHGLTKNETMVFGDFNNDLEMLQEAEYSYAMANAHPNVKRIANFSTTSNDDFGVERVLEELIREKRGE